MNYQKLEIQNFSKEERSQAYCSTGTAATLAGALTYTRGCDAGTAADVQPACYPNGNVNTNGQAGGKFYYCNNGANTGAAPSSRDMGAPCEAGNGDV